MLIDAGTVRHALKHFIAAKEIFGRSGIKKQLFSSTLRKQIRLGTLILHNNEYNFKEHIFVARTKISTLVFYSQRAKRFYCLVHVTLFQERIKYLRFLVSVRPQVLFRFKAETRHFKSGYVNYCGRIPKIAAWFAPTDLIIVNIVGGRYEFAAQRKIQTGLFFDAQNNFGINLVDVSKYP